MIKEFIRKKILNRRTQVIKKKINFLEKIKYNKSLLYKINSFGEKNKFFVKNYINIFYFILIFVKYGLYHIWSYKIFKKIY